MNKLLLISIDIIRQNDNEVNLGIGSIIAALKRNKGYNISFDFEHISINLGKKNWNTNEIYEIITSKVNIESFDFLAFGVYIWAEYFINKLLAQIRANGFRGKIILGGPQIFDKTQLRFDYPNADYFIIGYAEKSLTELITNQTFSNHFIKMKPDCNELESPYLSGVMHVDRNQHNVRIETKRGCPYKCNYCAHKGIQHNYFCYVNENRLKKELSLFKERSVKKINIIDPTFNVGTNYLAILDYIKKLNIDSKISLQARYESISGSKGEKFLDYCKKLNVILEFGIQSIHKEEFLALNRINDIEHIRNITSSLNKNQIDYEINLMIGIPHQTLESFKQNIEFAQSIGCKSIKTYPLQLLKGTELWRQKQKWGFVEENMGNYDIPYVVSSNSFNKEEWIQMYELAKAHSKNNLVI